MEPSPPDEEFREGDGALFEVVGCCPGEVAVLVWEGGLEGLLVMVVEMALLMLLVLI
jgi:hypothetical protein